MAEKISQTISIPQNSLKRSNSPIGPENWCVGNVDGLGNRTNASTTRTDVQIIAADTKMAEKTGRNIRRWQRRPRRPNSPYRLETETLKRPARWRHVSNKERNGCAPRNAPIEALDTRGWWSTTSSWAWLLLLLLMLGTGVDVVGVYKSVSDIMGLRGGCSPVVPSTSAMSSSLVAHTSWDLKEVRNVVITNHNTSNFKILPSSTYHPNLR